MRVFPVRYSGILLLGLCLLATGCAAGALEAESVSPAVSDKESPYRLEHDAAAFLTDAFLAGEPERELPYADIEWAEVPAAEDMRPLYGDDMEQRAMGSLNCAMTRSGALTNCSIDVMQPAGPRFERLFLSLARRFRAREDFARRYGGAIKWVGLFLSVENKEGKVNEKHPCLPTFCIPGLPPPPPPPPPDRGGGHSR